MSACRNEACERRFDARSIAASNHDLSLARSLRGFFHARKIAVLERNIDSGAPSGVGRESKNVQHAKIAVGHLCKADGVLQRQSMLACEPHVSRAFSPLRG